MNRDDKAENLLAALLHDKLLFFEIITRIDKEVFNENEYNNFLIELRKFYAYFKKLPNLQDFKAFTTSKPYPFTDFVFQAEPLINRDVVREKFYKNYQSQQALQFIERIAQRIDAEALDIGEAFEDMRKTVLSTRKSDDSYIELSADNIEYEYINARDLRISRTTSLIFKGVSKLLQGGISPGELAIFLAASNRGKTLYLVNELVNGMIQGERCLYLSMENKAPSIISRVSDRILMQDKDHQRHNETFSIKFLKMFYTLVKKPVIMYVPANSFSVDDLDIWLEEYEGKTGVKFDRILIDYLNKFKKKKMKDTWEAERFLTDDVRALGIRHDARMITAAQTSRAGAAIGRENSNTDTVDETMLQGGFGQFETADITLAYSETPGEKAKGVGRLTILKARDAGGRGREFVVNTAPWIGLMTDDVQNLFPEEKRHLLENPDTKFGQLPGLHEKKEKGNFRKKGNKQEEGSAPEVKSIENGQPEEFNGDMGEVTL